MVLYEGDPRAVSEALEKEAESVRARGMKPGIIDFRGDIREAARFFFARLRGLDRDGVDLILCAGVPEEGMGEAVMDRMRKAAGHHIVKV